MTFLTSNKHLLDDVQDSWEYIRVHRLGSSSTDPKCQHHLDHHLRCLVGMMKATEIAESFAEKHKHYLMFMA